ncbi:MAG: metal-dependent transcriptional regulator [Acidimicrobiia bacterium]|nr:metal-dependent transcriptional regulator [Acidimicrobiia bacterium]
MAQADADEAAVATSESEEMYLITIAMAMEEGQEPPIPVPQLADSLEVSRVSANEMIKKLEARGLIEYVPYKGAVLQPAGELIARRILRRRRLWSVFLAEQLGLTPQTADAVACEFEHVTPADVAQRLAEFLGDPKVGPQGKPIPLAVDEPGARAESRPLTELGVGAVGEVVRLDADSTVQGYLGDHGLIPGVEVTLLATSDTGGVLVNTRVGRLNLSKSIADLVGVVAVR